MKRRVLETEPCAVSFDGAAPHASRGGGRLRRRHAVQLLLLTALFIVVVWAGVLWLVSDADERDSAIAAAATELAASAQLDTWLSITEDTTEWQEASKHLANLITPDFSGVALQQILFVSCNRHDRSQDYWAAMAVAAQCEMLSRVNLTAAAPCRRLYAGVPPRLLQRASGKETEMGAMETEAAAAAAGAEPAAHQGGAVPAGGCGAVFDSPAAAQLRHRREQRDGAAAWGSPSAPFAAADAPVDALIWLGDAIYADKRADGEDGQSLLFHYVNSLEAVGRFWQTQRDAAEYNAFIDSCVAVSHTGATKTSLAVAAAVDGEEGTAGAMSGRAGQQHNVWGTWDDHDMGQNDGGRHYPHRETTQKYFLDFLHAAPDDPRWTREGVYESYTVAFHDVVDDRKGWGPATRRLLEQLYEHAVCVVLLDVRSFRDAPDATGTGDMLGPAQWAWLEAQLQHYATPDADGRARCAVVLIGGGIQFMMDEKPAENWAAFPVSRDRLLGLLRTYALERVAFITGDVHMGELGADFTDHAISRVLGYPMVEATSSGLTHSANMFFMDTFMPRLFPSPRRIGLYVERNFAALKVSLDLRQLPSIREYLIEMNSAAFTAPPSTGNTGTAAAATQRTPQWRRDVRAAAEQAINATFTVFSIPKGGQPVYRFNFPLAMLTHAHGPEYRNAVVDPRTGAVSTTASTSGGSPRENPADVDGSAPRPTVSLALHNGTVVQVHHYGNTHPVPLVTWSARMVQHYTLTGSSVSESLKKMLLAEAVMLVCVAVLAWRRLRKSRLSCRGVAAAALRSSSSGAHSHVSGDSLLARRWGRKLSFGWGKNKAT